MRMRKWMLPLVAVLALIAGSLVTAPAAEGYPCSIYKSWSTGDSLTASDLTTSFSQFVSTNAVASCLNTMSANATAMQASTSPGASGTESLASDLDGEIKRLRYALAAVCGTTYWYTQTENCTLSARKLVSTMGTITTSKPNLDATVTWNDGAVTFTALKLNVTNTASASASLLEDLQVGGSSMWKVDRLGNGQLAASLTIAGTGALTYNGRSQMLSGSDGTLTLVNSTSATFTRLLMGASGAAYVGLSVSAPVSSQAQGIIIHKADGTAQTHANLGAATDGSMIYCSDCHVTTGTVGDVSGYTNNTCAASGTGAMAFRLAGTWRCYQ